MRTRTNILTVVLFAWVLAAHAADKPNIVVILADDMGVGDVAILGGETSRIATPNIDRLTREGMRFTDAHTSSSVCTPTRYSLLTGRYSWRSRLKSGVLYGYSPPLIDADRPTVARFLKDEGYATACIGKWHLGMRMPTTDRKSPSASGGQDDAGKPITPDSKDIDWAGSITDGPIATGFDSFFGISASLDMPPYIWIHDDRFVGECTVTKAFHRRGPAHADFDAVDVLGEITKKSVEWIHANKARPMFLYVPLASPHTPIVPSKDWKGKSTLGAYGDFVMETDHAVGEIVEAVDTAGLAANTLIIVTADNGCSPAAESGMKSMLFRGAKREPAQPGMHYPSGIYRGHKSDLFEGGHRVPFIARWTGKIPAGSICDQAVCQVDLYATCADLLGRTLDDHEAPDSVSLRPAFEGNTDAPFREATVHHSIDGSFAIRKGKWKLLLCPDSGGWSKPTKKEAEKQKLTGFQLYDLASDPQETVNVQAEHPEIVADLRTLLARYVSEGRSTPGASQKNDGPERWPQLEWMR
jgi:arylsulfatase A-like enzyme